MGHVPLAAALLLAASCAGAPSAPPRVPDLTLTSPDGSSLALVPAVSGARATVIVFFSASCHCLKVHDDRLRDLYATYHPRGVEILLVDSEPSASTDRDAAEARDRRYPFPILLDPQAKLARALGAEYATYTVVVDPSGHVAYSGGIDTDEMHLHPDATPYVANALDDLLSGRPPRLSHGKALGCVLER